MTMMIIIIDNLIFNNYKNWNSKLNMDNINDNNTNDFSQ